MAKKKDKQTEPEIQGDDVIPKSHKRKKGKKGLVILGIILVLGLVGFMYRKPINSFLAKNLSGVPVINKVFKEEQDENPYINFTKEQLISTLESQKLEIEDLNKASLQAAEENKLLQEKITALKEYETKYEEFLAQKETWDTEVAKTNPQLFITQFEKIYPDTANQIYQDIKIDEVMTKQQKNFSSTVAQMDEEQAAKALEVLIPTDPELVKVIFEGMQAERKSLILSNMAAENAATVIKLLSPTMNTTNN